MDEKKCYNGLRRSVSSGERGKTENLEERVLADGKGGRSMQRKLWILGALLMVVLAKDAGASTMRLDADTLNYDPSMQKVLAQGHVTLHRGTSRMVAKTGEARTDGSVFSLRGSVSADLKEEGISLWSEELTYFAGEKGRIVASGDVLLRRGKDALSCDVVVWRFGATPSYHARGHVHLAWEEKHLWAGTVSRDGEIFRTTNLERFEDKPQGMTLLSPALEGRFEGDDVVEVVASGGVRLELRRTNKLVVVTGAKGIYSTKRGTLVISGGATAKQEGRSVRAESLVLRLDSGRIEALGKPQVVFPVSKP